MTSFLPEAASRRGSKLWGCGCVWPLLGQVKPCDMTGPHNSTRMRAPSEFFHAKRPRGVNLRHSGRFSAGDLDSEDKSWHATTP